MLYKLVCPWSEKDGHTSYAPNVSEAASIFSTLVFGDGWVKAKIAEDAKDNSCIVISPNNRPFKIIQYQIQSIKNNLNTIVKKQKFNGKMKSVDINGIVVSDKESRCVGFVAKPKDASFIVNDLTGYTCPHAASNILENKNKLVGYIDLVKSPTIEIVVEMMNKMREIGASAIYSFGNKNTSPSKKMLSVIGFSVSAIDDCYNGEPSMLMSYNQITRSNSSTFR